MKIETMLIVVLFKALTVVVAADATATTTFTTDKVYNVGDNDGN